jgi:hypothetical protein
LRTKKEVYWGPEIFQYFWRLKNWIVGPLSEGKTSGSGLFYWGKNSYGAIGRKDNEVAKKEALIWTKIKR